MESPNKHPPLFSNSEQQPGMLDGGVLRRSTKVISRVVVPPELLVDPTGPENAIVVPVTGPEDRGAPIAVLRAPGAEGLVEPPIEPAPGASYVVKGVLGRPRQ